MFTRRLCQKPSFARTSLVRVLTQIGSLRSTMRRQRQRHKFFIVNELKQKLCSPLTCFFCFCTFFPFPANEELALCYSLFFGCFFQLFIISSCWLLITVNSRLAHTSLLRTAAKSPAKVTEVWLKYTPAITDSRCYGPMDTLFGPNVTISLFSLSRYSGHRAASWNICTHIKSIFSPFLDCLCIFWSISASSVNQWKFLLLFLLRHSLQSRYHE